MRVETLRLKQFRNVSALQLEFHPNLNFFFGKNGVGKTNLLEALFFLFEGKSFRTSEYKNLIHQGQEISILEAKVTLKNGTQQINAKLLPHQKEFFKEGKKTNRAGMRHLLSILFAPEEILVVKGSPQDRRQSVDNLLCHLSSKYFELLRDYKKILLQRNQLLKNEELSTDSLRGQLSLWNESLILKGTALMEERRCWIAHWNRYILDRYRCIAGQNAEVELSYRPHVSGEEWREKLEFYFERERLQKTSLVGPHRDDFPPLIDGGEVRAFRSQGEARSFTLAMKLSEIDLFREIWGEDPILLLDDVASELDPERNEAFFSYLSNYGGQVFVTATSKHLVPLSQLSKNHIWEMPLNP